MYFTTKNITVGFLLLVLLLASNVVFSQSIKGIVEGQGEGLLMGASVILYESDSTSMLGFSIADEHGNWQINTQAQAGMILSASHLGYETYYLRLEDKHLKLDSIHILLGGMSEKLSEVTVEAKRLSVVVSGDTITYNASSFRGENDRTLGDILSKMPGIEVTSNGDIQYNGKRVDKILVEGKDLLADQHKLTTEGFQAEDIQAIKFIEQYRAFSEQYLPFNTGKVAMDIQLTDKAKRAVNGDVELLGGYRNAYQASSNLYRIREKSGLTSFARSNNVGEPVISQGDFLSLQGNFMKVLNQTMGDFSQIIPEGFTTSADVQRNIDNILLTNFEWNQTQNSKLRIATMGNFSRREANADIERTYSQLQTTQYGSSSRQITFPYFYAKMDLEKRFPNKEKNIMLELPIYADLTSNEQQYNGEIANIGAENAFSNKQQKFRMSPDFRFSKRLSSQKSYFVQADAYLESLEKHIQLRQEGQMATEIGQTNSDKTAMFHSTLGYVHQLGDWNLSGSVGVSAFHKAKELISPEVPLYEANFQHQWWNPKVETNIRYEKGALMGEGTLAVAHNSHRLDAMQNQNTLVQSAVSFRYKFSLLHFILLKVAFAQKENAHNLAYGTFEFLDENTLQHNSLKLGSFANTSSLNLSYYWFDRDKKITLHTLINYHDSKGALFQDFQVENGLFIQSYSQVDENSTVDLLNNFSWKWAAKNLRFKVETGLNYAKNITPTQETINQRHINQKIGIYYEPKTSGLELGYSYAIRQQSRIWEGAKQTFLAQSHTLNATYTKGAISIKGTLGHQRMDNRDLSNQFTTLDILTEYRLKKDWSIKLNGRDLFNLSPRKIFTNKLTTAYFETLSYRRFPGTVTLGLKKLI